MTTEAEFIGDTFGLPRSAFAAEGLHYDPNNGNVVRVWAETPASVAAHILAAGGVEYDGDDMPEATLESATEDRGLAPDFEGRKWRHGGY